MIKEEFEKAEYERLKNARFGIDDIFEIKKDLAPRVPDYKGRKMKKGEFYCYPALKILGIDVHKMYALHNVSKHHRVDVEEKIVEVEDITGEKFESKPVLRVTNYTENIKLFWNEQPFFYDKHKMWWLWNKYKFKWEIIDEIDLMNAIDKQLNLSGETVDSKTKQNYIEAAKRIGRAKQPKEAPIKWIQFKDKAYSLKSKKVYDVKPNYFFTNPIQWEIGKSDKTPTLDKLFKEWVGKDYVDTLYEMIAYCCYRDYPIQLLFCLYGIGRNGKSCFLKVLTKFIGKDNLCSTDLDLLTGSRSSRFESFKLYKKLACLMGETNFGVLATSSILKKLTGGDVIGFEKKNKDPFDDFNYAKLIIASNSLPSSEDTSEGFYRRWVIIDFPNQFPEGKDITKTIPEEEYRNLAFKVCKLLPKMIKKGEIYNQGNIEERKQKYIMASNPLPFFLENFCYRSHEVYVSHSELYNSFCKFLTKTKKRLVSRKEFNGVLLQEGLEQRRTTKKINGNFERNYWVEGVTLKENFKKLLENLPKNPLFPLNCNSFTRIESNNKIKGKTDKMGQTQTPQDVVDSPKKPQDIDIDLLLGVIRETGSKGYSKTQFALKYGAEVTEKLLKQGEILENPAEVLRVAE